MSTEEISDLFFAPFKSLLTKLRSSEVLELATEKQGCRNELEKWEKILQDIQPLFIDADVRQREKWPVKGWLDELQHLAYDMDDILDVFATKSLERKVMQKQQDSTSKVQKFVSAIFIMPTAFKYFNIGMMLSKMKTITHRLQGSANLVIHLGLREISRSTEMRLETHSFISHDMVYEREKDTENIVELLLNNTVADDGVAVIPIVGTEGIGKTTLAQLVYNDDKVKDYFDFKAWISVSDVFDLIRITKVILEQTGSEVYGAIDLNMLQIRLYSKLSNKKFLLVLDDVWIEKNFDWGTLLSPLKSGASGSKILVTTRNPIISGIMRANRDYRLEGLSNQACFSMFTKSALGAEDFSGYPHLKEIGKEIVKRCNGLPLAAKALGASLRYNFDQNEWRNILNSILSPSTESSETVVSALLLNYNSLPYRLKQCFAYCSIFPYGYEFREEEIVLLWMAEGFLLEVTNGMDMENLGRVYFKELVARSFFQRSIMDKSRFLMHDLINLLAQSVARTICCRMERDRLTEMSKYICNLRHLSYDSALSDEFKNFKSKNLRTFIPIILPPPHNTYRCLPNNILLDLLPNLKFSRVLSLREFSMSQLPDSIGDLRHLRYLDFSHAKIKSLPDSVCALHNLQTLLLRQCSYLEKLPLRIGNLINLRHLDITETFSLRGIPIQISELTNLQTLSRFVLARGNGCHIRALKNLQNLKGELSISGLQNIFTAEDALEASLGDKSGLKRLKLKWSDSFDRDLSKGVERDVLDVLQPPKELEELTVEGYDGTLFPDWVGQPSFSSLLYLELKNCKNCTSMPSIGKLPQLRELCIRGCNSMNCVDVEFYGQNRSNALLSLETLCFEDMLEWKEWNPCEVDELTSNFPRLRELSIIRCPKLSGSLPSHLPSLEKLVIRGCKELKVSVSTFPMLHELEIVGCKNLVHTIPAKSSSLKEVSVSNILELTYLTDQRLMFGFRNVESLEIAGCEELISLWPNRTRSLAHMGSLDVLKISNCPKFVLLEAEEDEEELQQVDIPRSVNHLDLSLMSSERVKKLPKASRMFTSLKELSIERCPKLVSLSEVCFPLTLERLVISYCKNLKYFLLDKGKDININNSSLLEHLEIERCRSLLSLSSNCKSSVRLPNQQIDSGSKLASLSSSVKLLEGIKQLRINHCPELLFIELPVRLQHLQVWYCEKLTVLSQRDKLPKELKRLQISNCQSLTSIAQTIHDNTSLEYIGVIGCKAIKFLPKGLDKLRHLQEIELVYCSSLESFPESRLPTTNLKELHIDDCKELKSLPDNFHELTSLEKLEILNCCFPKEGFPINLKSLSVSKPKTQKTLKEWELHKLTSLELLMIEGGDPDVVSFPPEDLEMILPTSLVQLTVKDFPRLQFLSSKHFEKLTSIKYLSLMDCPKVMSLPNTLGSLYRLHIDDCPLLKTRCLISRLEWHKIADIPYVRIDDKLLNEDD